MIPRQHDLYRSPGWTPLEEQEGKAFGQALREAVTAGTPKTSGRNIFRLVEGESVPLNQGQAAEAYETVEILPCGAVCTDRRRVH